MTAVAETSFGRSKKWTLPEGPEKEENGPNPDASVEVEETRGAAIFKVAKSTCLIITWFCMGLYSGITGPTVPDLGERLNANYDRVGFAIAFRSIGKMFGSLTGGYLRDRFSSKGDLILGVALIVVALSVVTKPWVTTVGVLAFLFIVEGFCHGGINSVGNSMCVLMWKEKAALPVHLLHFGYGVGALVSPLVARPFLSQHVSVNVTSNWTDLGPVDPDELQENGTSYILDVNAADEVNRTLFNSTTNATFKLEDVIVKESLIEIPYAIVSGFVFLIGVAYVGFFLHKPFRRMTTIFGSTSYTKPCDAPFLKDRPKSAVSILALFFIYYMMTTAIDRALGSFLFTYAVESHIGFTKSEAAYLNTGYFACYAAGRAIMGLVALKLPVKYIIFIEVYLMTVSSAVITFFAYDKHLYLWIFSCTLAFFFGPIYPTGVSWVDRYIPLYGLVVAIFDVGNGIGAFVANWLSGVLISTLGPHSLLYFTFAASAIICATIVLAQIIGTSRGDRHKASKHEVTMESQEK